MRKQLMSPSDNDVLLVTGATGLVGSHVVESARKAGWIVRALVRRSTDGEFLRDLGVELRSGDLESPESLQAALVGVTHIVHCAAKVGDWGPYSEYERVNVQGLRSLWDAAWSSQSLRRFVLISSLGVYPARDHYGTDELEPLSETGIDSYTRSKIAAEGLLKELAARDRVPFVILRPGFIYGPRDRTVVPRVVDRLRSGQFAYLGSGENLLNNTAARNLATAVLLALETPNTGEAYNITDGRLVSKREFIETICRGIDVPFPQKRIPLWFARMLASGLERVWRLLGREAPPPLSQATIKFLGFNTDYSIEKARQFLGFDPQLDFSEAMQETLDVSYPRDVPM